MGGVWAAIGVAGLALASGPGREQGWLPTHDGLKLHYSKHGDGPQAVVVPLGFWMEADFQRLAGAGRTLVFYDQRNRGRSEVAPPERSRLEDEVRDLETLRVHLGLGRISTIGYSYLGLMTVMYAMRYPHHVERLVQLGPVPRRFGTSYPPDQRNDAPPQLSQAQREEIERLRSEGMPEQQPREYCVREWQVMRFYLVGDPAHVAALGAGHCDLPNEWPVRQWQQWERRRPLMEKLDLPLAEIRKVTQPVLTIHGTRDRNAPYGAGREWASILPDARLLSVPGAAHQSWDEAPELVFAAIETFLAGRWPAAAERVER